MEKQEFQEIQQIDPQAFQNAFKAARSYPGMGSLKLTVQFNPYECEWEWKALIDFSDNSKYEGSGNTSKLALDEAASKVHDNPPKIYY